MTPTPPDMEEPMFVGVAGDEEETAPLTAILPVTLPAPVLEARKRRLGFGVGAA